MRTYRGAAEHADDFTGRATVVGDREDVARRLTKGGADGVAARPTRDDDERGLVVRPYGLNLRNRRSPLWRKRGLGLDELSGQVEDRRSWAVRAGSRVAWIRGEIGRTHVFSEDLARAQS